MELKQTLPQAEEEVLQQQHERPQGMRLWII
jgi:hypothetical protein